LTQLNRLIRDQILPARPDRVTHIEVRYTLAQSSSAELSLEGGHVSELALPVRLSVSQWVTTWLATQRSNPLGGPGWASEAYSLYTQRDPFVFQFNKLILPDSRLAEKHRSCHAGVGYRSSFPHSTRNSQFLSFLSPKFELVPFPHLHHAVFFHFRSSLASLWLQKGIASLHLRLAPEKNVMVICFWSQQIRHKKVD
jgi:hypothetical protein